MTGKLLLASATVPSVVSSTAQCNADLAEAQSLLSYSSPEVSEVQAALQDVYSKVLADAPGAQLEVLNYPQLFTTRTVNNFCPVTGGITLGGATYYGSYSSAHITEFDQIQTEFDTAIAFAVATLKGEGDNINFVNVNVGTQNKALPCNTKTNGKADINSLMFAPGSAFSSLLHNCSVSWPSSSAPLGITCSASTWTTFRSNIQGDGSFHPKATAHANMAQLVVKAMKSKEIR